MPLLASAQQGRRHTVHDRAIAIRVVNAGETPQIGAEEALAHVSLVAGGQRVETFGADGAIRLRAVEASADQNVVSRYRRLSAEEGIALLPRPLSSYSHIAVFPRTDASGPEVRIGTASEIRGERLDDVGLENVQAINWDCPGLRIDIVGDINVIRDPDAAYGSDRSPGVASITCVEPGLLALECPSSLAASEEGAFTAFVSPGTPDAPVEWSGTTGPGGVYPDGPFGTVDAAEGSGPFEARFTPFVLSPGGVFNPVNNEAGAELLETEARITASIGYDTGDKYGACVVYLDAAGDLPSAPGLPNPTALPGNEEILAYVGIGYNLDFDQFSPRVGVRARVPVSLPLFGDVSLGFLGDNGGGGSLLLQAEALCRMQMSPLLAIFYGLGVHTQRRGSMTEIGPGGSVSAAYRLGDLFEAGAEASVSRLYGATILEPAVRVGFRF